MANDLNRQFNSLLAWCSIAFVLMVTASTFAQPVTVTEDVLENDWGGELYCYAGRPVKDGLQILESTGHTVGYDAGRRLPAWVAYPLNIDQVSRTTAKRPSRFSTDTRVENPVRHDDYTYSGFDRGHLAPNMAIGLQFGKAAQLETFLLTNICPQDPPLNRGTWKSVEAREQHYWRRQFCEIWTLVGPVFSPQDETLASGIGVPNVYWRITLDEDPENQTLRVIALLFAESDSGDWAYKSVSVDEVERLTGLDFFPLLPDGIEKSLESAVADSHWWSSSFRTECDSDGASGLPRPVIAERSGAGSGDKNKPDQRPEDEDDPVVVGGYWITTSSGVRHNSSCRWYRKSKGRPGSASAGRPCKICGG